MRQSTKETLKPTKEEGGKRKQGSGSDYVPSDSDADGRGGKKPKLSRQQSCQPLHHEEDDDEEDVPIKDEPMEDAPKMEQPSSYQTTSDGIDQPIASAAADTSKSVALQDSTTAGESTQRLFNAVQAIKEEPAAPPQKSLSPETSAKELKSALVNYASEWATPADKLGLDIDLNLSAANLMKVDSVNEILKASRRVIKRLVRYREAIASERMTEEEALRDAEAKSKPVGIIEARRSTVEEHVKEEARVQAAINESRERVARLQAQVN